MTNRRLRAAARQMITVALERDRVGHGLMLGQSIEATHALQRALGETPRCRRCRCTDARACAGGCSWVEAALCSKCDGRR